MILWDTHMHSSFSGDCDEAPRAMADEALAKGLKGINFTDHLDIDYFHQPGRFDLDIPAYMSEIRYISEEYSDKGLTVGCGIEIGLQEHLTAKHREILSENDFDQVIGSIHQVDGADPYYAEFYAGRDIYDCYEDYLGAAITNLSLFAEIDTFGHLDYISRYGRRHLGDEKGALRYEEHKASIDKILGFLIDSGIALEVNTGAFRCDMTEPNPSYEILLAYYHMGGRLITIGADAHHTEHVALCFDTVCGKLSEIGFTEYAVYQKRKPLMLPL